jgi:hypothetical protein
MKLCPLIPNPLAGRLTASGLDTQKVVYGRLEGVVNKLFFLFAACCSARDPDSSAPSFDAGETSMLCIRPAFPSTSAPPPVRPTAHR